MKRSGFAKPALVRKDRSAEFASYQPPKASAKIAALFRPPVTAPKREIVRSEAYRRLVAAMPCFYCGLGGASQAAHANEGKGMAMKADDRTCFPMCWPHHAQLDQGGLLGDKEARREFERRAGRYTRARILLDGNWPKDVPMWEDA